jgi:hypothetical protein
MIRQLVSSGTEVWHRLPAKCMDTGFKTSWFYPILSGYWSRLKSIVLDDAA